MTHQVAEFLSIQPCVVHVVCQPPSQFLCVVTADTTTVCVVRVHKDNRHLLLSQHNNLLQFIHVNIALYTVIYAFSSYLNRYTSSIRYFSNHLHCIDSSISTQRNRRTTKENTMMCLIGLWITRLCIDNADICAGCGESLSYSKDREATDIYYWRVV